MIKCLFSDHLAKVKSRKPVECQATHVLFLRVGSLCLSWFLSSPVGEASSVNMDTASSLLHPHCCFCAKVGSTANWQCPCLGDVYNFSQFLSIMLALERFCLWGSERNGAGGGESAGLLFKLLIFPERCWGRCWCGLRAVHFGKSAVWMIVYWFHWLIILFSHFHILE